ALVVILLVVATAAIICVFVLLTKLNHSQIDEAAASERLTSKEKELAMSAAELAAVKEVLAKSQSEFMRSKEELAGLHARSELERSQFDERIAFIERSKEQLGESFKNIANDLLESKSKSLSQSSKENITALLSPLQEKITQFEKRVEETYDKESKERFSLAREIKSLQALNNKISEDAVNLTNALKSDNKAQGAWGEFVLESILEKSGLTKGREYEVQVALKAEDGSKSQPDIIVHLPESRDIVIDSKVSLKAWDAFCSSDKGSDRDALLKQHIASIRQHVKTLSAKDYQNLTGLNSLDYVFLFMPVEAAYSSAVQVDRELFQYAFDRNIIFVVPSTLLTTLRTVQNLWRLAQQNQNANEIADRAGALYDKFVAFVDDLEEVGGRIDATRKSFEKARNKLVSGRGNLVKRAEALRELGAKTSKKQNTKLVDLADDGNEAEEVLQPKQGIEGNDKNGTRH
ncbi:MAG: DNA recombination protein RmuC, partial [Pseudomonadota bacterium]|nr:DNA recombination protein RmuC [Pseudomonadota bacterium]